MRNPLNVTKYKEGFVKVNSITVLQKSAYIYFFSIDCNEKQLIHTLGSSHTLDNKLERISIEILPVEDGSSRITSLALDVSHFTKPDEDWKILTERGRYRIDLALIKQDPNWGIKFGKYQWVRPGG